jgi:hypothetical protein
MTKFFMSYFKELLVVNLLHDVDRLVPLVVGGALNEGRDGHTPPQARTAHPQLRIYRIQLMA